MFSNPFPSKGSKRYAAFKRLMSRLMTKYGEFGAGMTLADRKALAKFATKPKPARKKSSARKKSARSRGKTITIKVR